MKLKGYAHSSMGFWPIGAQGCYKNEKKKLMNKTDCVIICKQISNRNSNILVAKYFFLYHVDGTNLGKHLPFRSSLI